MRPIYLTLIAFLIQICNSCQKDPENYPLDKVTKEFVFDKNDPNGALALEYLTNIYSHIPQGFNRVADEFLDVATDDAVPSRDQNGAIELLRSTKMNANSSNPDGFWTTGYSGIRKVNIFLENIDQVPFNVPGAPDMIAYLKAEARFLRVYFYFELLKRYGGVPLIGDTIYQINDKMNLKRNTFEEVINYIINECDLLIDIARPEEASNTDINWGRITQGVILTLKAKVLNYAASPLYNGKNIAAGDPLKESLQGYTSYDVNRWNKAAEAAKAVIDLKRYSLTTLQNLFTLRKNSEMIFSVLRPTTRDIMQLTGPIGFYETNTSAKGLISPTQELIDAFPMSTGENIKESENYSENNPYINRDPRLERSIFLNGTNWLRRPLEMFEGGLDKPNEPGRVQTRTGYYSKKYLNFNFQTSFEYSLQHVNFQIFRYADLLLMRAEALNEANETPPTEVFDLLKLIRIRAGIPAGNNNHGIPLNMTRDQIRTFIQNERRIELYLEEQRYWDVRRWKLAEEFFNKQLHGMKIIKSGNSFIYQKVPVINIEFNERMYFYPIPAKEVLNNPNMIQNKGW